MGVWIEIVMRASICIPHLSLPAWECGLKYAVYEINALGGAVTPCVGVWIEIRLKWIY